MNVKASDTINDVKTKIHKHMEEQFVGHDTDDIEHKFKDLQ